MANARPATNTHKVSYGHHLEGRVYEATCTGCGWFFVDESRDKVIEAGNYHRRIEFFAPPTVSKPDPRNRKRRSNRNEA